MGTWSQRQRRSTAPKGIGGAVSIVDVIEQDGNNVHVVFDGPVHFLNIFTHDGAFDVQGVEPNDGEQVDAVTISVGVPGTNAGDSWTLAAQPSWLAEPIAPPQGGTVS